MKLTLDLDHNVAYLRLREATTGVETIQLSSDLNIDIAPDGSVYGIEFLNPREQLLGTDGGRVVIVDEVAGQTREVPLGT